MKFKATISHHGLKRLEKGFLPTLEKFGKNCQMLLSPEEICLVQDSQDSDGLQIVNRLANDTLYEPGTCVCSSRYHDLIAFNFEIALLLKVLRSAAAHDADALDMRLAMRAVTGSNADGGQPAKRPVLTFTWRGQNISITQDMPISKPYSESAVEDVRLIAQVASICPFYVDIINEVPRLQAVVDKLKQLSQDVTLTTAKQGDLHLVVATSGVVLGEGIRGLRVRPIEAQAQANPLQSITTEGRRREAEQLGDGVSACVAVKHLGRALHSSLLSHPGILLCGIAENGMFIHLLFGFNNPTGPGFDDDVSLSYKIPVKEEM